MAVLFAPYLRATDQSNTPISGAFLSFYATQTSTPQPIFADVNLTIALQNPLPADSNGVYPVIWLDDSLPPYKVVQQYPDVDDPTIPGAIVTGPYGTVDPYNTSFGLLLSGMNIEALSYAASPNVASGVAQYTDTTNVTLHGDYSFLAQTTINYRGGDPIYGHASFADFSNIVGSVSQDHYHSFQSSMQWADSGTIGRLCGFYSRGDVTGSGTVTEYSHFKADDATAILGAAGTINNQYGFRVGPLTRGVGNYAFYSDNVLVPSMLAGPIYLGFPDATLRSVIQYDGMSGNLQLISRQDADYKVHILSKLLIGGGAEVFAASIINDASSGNLKITPRTGFITEITSPLMVDSTLTANGPVVPRSFTVATAPTPASAFTGGIIFVSNESGGAVLAFSDGTNWRRVTDRAIIS